MKMYYFTEENPDIPIEISANIWQGNNGELLNLFFDIHFDKAKIDSDFSGLWRYRNFLPIQNKENIVTLGEMMTPLSTHKFYGKEVWIKSEFLFPSGSYKDRGAAVLISKMKELGAKKVIEDSSGNAGCAIAAYAANANIACEIFVPENTSASKVFQIELYGAKVNRIEGERAEAGKAAKMAAQNIPFASHVWNPFFFQGTKTFAYELFEQFKGKLPEHILFPVGNGTLLIGAYMGFADLIKSGLLHKMPSLHIIQAQNCAPLLGNKVFLNTIAEGIAVSVPARINQILKCAAESGGEIFVVNEDEIKGARWMAAKSGFYIEYTSSVALAALKYFNKSGEVLIPFTGNGLKNPY